MKTITRICLSLLLAACAVRGESFRTDINPALRYYQAYLLAPDISAADQDFLFTNFWTGQKLPDRYGELVARSDNQFKLIRQAAHAAVPCDWGIDMSEGPGTLLPGLARAKAVAQAARFRICWALEQGRQADARDDFLAAFALARNVSRDGTLIAALVQIAMEAIDTDILAENFGRFTPQTLQEIEDGFASLPAPGTIAGSLVVERSSFHDWLIPKIVELQQKHPGDDAAVMAGVRELVKAMDDSEASATNPPARSTWERVTQAAGGTSDGLIRFLHQEGRLYDRLTVIASLPYPEFEAQVKQFSAELQKSPSPLFFLPAYEKARRREVRVEVWLAMVRAAIDYKLHGAAGLQSVKDPAGQGPFAFQRFMFEGQDRGFQLKSVYQGSGFPEVLIFVEKPGSPFRVDGPYAGQARSK